MTGVFTLNFTKFSPADFPERYEVIDGIIYDMTPPPLEIHQRIITNLIGEFILYLKNKPCKVYTAPFGVWWNANSEEHVEPDLVVICDSSKILEKGCVGAPDLIVEVLSRATASKDKGVKLRKYRASGVREYWIVDPVNELVEVYFFQENVFREPDIFDTMETTMLYCGIFDDLNIEVRRLFL